MKKIFLALLMVAFAVATAQTLAPQYVAAASTTTPFSFTGGGTTPFMNCSPGSSGSLTWTSGTGEVDVLQSGDGGASYSVLLSETSSSGSPFSFTVGGMTGIAARAIGAGTIAGNVSCTGAGPTPTPSTTLPPGASGFVALYQQTPPPSPQSSVAYLNELALGGAGNFFTSIPSPQVSASAPALLFATKGSGTVWLYNGADFGINSNAVFSIGYNNQGTALTELYDFFNNNGLLAQGGNGFISAALPTPAAPTPTCSPGGASGGSAYFVKLAYVSKTGITAAGPEGTVTCGASTVLQVPNPGTVLGESYWNVYASTTTGAEKLQTQGTSPTSGTNVPATAASWISTDTLAGSTNPQTQDTAAQCWRLEVPPSYNTLAKICPYGANQLNGPLQVPKAVNTPASYVPMVYTNAGASTTTTYHGAQFSCTFSSSSSCTLGASYFSGAAAFASGTSIDGCSIASGATDGVQFVFHQTGAGTGTFYASASNSDTITGVCWGS